MKKIFLSSVILWLSVMIATGQSLSDTTINLRGVTVTAKAKRVDANIGSNTTFINPQAIEATKSKSLSELLTNNSLIHIKSVAQGGLSTSSFRGTAANHTQVNWNGININSSMGGSVDFSRIPVFFVDDVVLFHGNGYLKNGTGALGGSINLGNMPNWTNKNETNGFIEIGSYETYSASASKRFTKGKFQSNTRAYYTQSKNNYRYLNKVLQVNPFYEHRKEADYNMGGLMQELYYRLGTSQMLTGNIWFQTGKRSLPQPIIVVKTQHEEDQQHSLRATIGYQNIGEKSELNIRVANILDIFNYNISYDDFEGRREHNTSNSVVLKGDYTYMFTDLLKVNGAMHLRHDRIDAENYDVSKRSRTTATLQVGSEWTPITPLSLNLSLMGEANNHIFMPTFSAGGRFALIPEVLSLKASAAYNYHYPSMNDLYWNPGGNPNLKPEQGMSYDVSLAYTQRFNHLGIKANASYYRMNIENWIVWLPTESYFWAPQNIYKVLSHGFEFSAEGAFNIGKVSNLLLFNLGYTLSLNKSNPNDPYDKTYNKQLPYIPKLKTNAKYKGEYRNFFVGYTISYTGVRYTTTDHSYKTNPYTIHDAEAGYRFKIHKVNVTAKLRVDNLFNAYYESTQYYPMPLRSFSGSLLIHL
ncbi:MAG: TonB-dependent receptor plug domain-containing protein [Tannerellaceae bacterium]